MITTTKSVTFDSAHRLPQHKGLCSNIHGHTYKLQATVNCPEFLDFADLKQALVKVANVYDHTLIFNETDPVYQEMRKHDAIVENCQIVLLDVDPTAENMTGMMAERLQHHLDAHGATVIKVDLWETPTSFATWRKD